MKYLPSVNLLKDAGDIWYKAHWQNPEEEKKKKKRLLDLG